MFHIYDTWYGGLGVYQEECALLHNVRLTCVAHLWHNLESDREDCGKQRDRRGKLCVIVCVTETAREREVVCWWFLLQPLKLHYHDGSLSSLSGVWRHTLTHTWTCSKPCTCEQTCTYTCTHRLSAWEWDTCVCVCLCVCTDPLTHSAGLEPLYTGMLMFSKETITQQRACEKRTNRQRGGKPNIWWRQNKYMIWIRSYICRSTAGSCNHLT